MSRWLVSIEVAWPPDMDPDRKSELLAGERAESHRLQRAGQLVDIWRVPGRTASWSIWEATDATELHDLVSGLPAWPWMSVVVHPLAQHANALTPEEKA